MHTIDRSFKRKKERASQKKRRGKIRRVLLAFFAVLLLAGLPTLYLTVPIPDAFRQWLTPDGELVPEEVVEPQIPDYAYAPTIVDLAGDPLVIRLGGDDGSPAKLRAFDTPQSLIKEGLGRNIKVVADSMLKSGVQLMTTLPSKPQDFAFFQAQKSRAPTGDGDPASDSGTGADEEPEIEISEDDSENLPADDVGAGWGETVEHGTADLPEFKKTRIENTTSVAQVVSENDRYAATQDFIVQILSERTLDSFLQEKHFQSNDAKRAGEAMKSLLGLDVIRPGFVVAARGLRDSVTSTQFKLVQVSIYNTEAYVGTLALGDDGSYGPGADPWVKEDLFNYAQNNQTVAKPRKYRYLDAIYSAAIRNKVPTGIVGETIVLMSRAHDLNAFADDDDEFVLIYSDSPRDAERNSGRVLYAAINNGDKELICYVYREKKSGDYSCLSDAIIEHSVTVRDGMVTPVNGVLTSRFGPRKHPILKTVRIHKGVDWAAPTGNPVFAAFDGTVSFAGDGKGYGNFIKIKHRGNRSTGYAHLNGFASGMAKGKKVKAGDVIGYVGTTGLSTGPHLHFELYAGKVAIDPLASSSSGVGGSKSAEVLVNKIIRVESGGRADAKNPLSTATGLGQFIESTWLRMIRTYRPELMKNLSRQEVLALRTDPTISREMLHHLARENESHLKARGHSITAGRLYLAHFLGPKGANTVLSSAADTSLLELLGAAVIKANPFLTGKDAQWVINWAERKMAGRGKRYKPVVSKRKVRRQSKAFLAYKKAINDFLETTKAEF